MSTNKIASSSSTVCKNLEFGIYSRRAFRNEFREKASPRDAYLAKQSSNKGFKEKREEKPWPKSVRIAGYSILVLGVPYSILTIISESPSLQDSLQQSTYGRKLMEQILRPYWGDVDAHSYVDDDEENVGISLYNEPSLIVRKAQDEIHSLCDDQTHYNVQILHTASKNDMSYDSVQKKELDISGSTLVRPQNVAQKLDLTTNDDVTVLALEFLDTQDNSESFMMDRDEIQMAPTSNSIGEYYLRTMTNIWSTWHYFNETPGNNGNSSNNNSSANSSAMDSRPVYDETEMARLDLEHNLNMLQSEYNDPNSTKDRDDLIQEMEKYKNEIRHLKKNARWHRVKSLFSR